jgi:hypothetical protein
LGVKAAEIPYADDGRAQEILFEVWHLRDSTVPAAPRGISFTLAAMNLDLMLGRLGLHSGWAREAVFAGLCLAAGFGLMPPVIFFAGSSALGRYEGASVARLYASVYQGLAQGSIASWIVVLGPYGLYLLFKALRLWWRAGAHPA